MHQTVSRPYFPNLDGLRFLAFMAVFISHIAIFILKGQYWLAQGDLGVSFFFVLSGFLITYLLFHEKEAMGSSIKLSHFYARRILRIWPVYFMTLAIGIIIASTHISSPFSTIFMTSSWPWYTGFLANFYLIAHPETSVIVAVLWSISVEEQFYFIWPIMLTVIKKRCVPVFLWSVIVIATIFRFVHANDYNTVAYSTFSSMADLSMGALLGYAAFYKVTVFEWVKNHMTKNIVIGLYATLGFFLYVKMFFYPLFPTTLHALYVPIQPFIFSVLFAMIILEQNYSTHSLFKIGNSKITTYLGKISYGLYAYHIIAIAAITYLLSLIQLNSAILVIVFSFALVVSLASLSYRYIEQKILRLRKFAQ